ncbi:hypothetical protein HPB49_024636 [Dermacentor silvarum]|uniref:Uncharacterized protein n=1 Tax=Dermacentor silvarum TaxID=543639 RepID=A0ACB8CCA3_DERSI|nr:hypothetical protein HPB49_024636 [Dermacentor silvarum]
MTETAATTTPARTSVMTTTLGSLAEFFPDSGNIDLGRFCLYATANKVDASGKSQVFLTVLGEKAYATLRSLLLPKKTNGGQVRRSCRSSPKALCSKTVSGYRTVSLLPAKARTVRKPETVRRLAENTGSFETFLEEVLRDRLITAIRTDSIRCRLLALSDDEVTYERLCQIANALETAQ